MLRSEGPDRPPNEVQPGCRHQARSGWAAGQRRLVRYSICVPTQILETPAKEDFRAAVGMLKLLGDETRLRVIWTLLEGEHSVNELAEKVGAQPAAVSQHLAKLRLARLVRSRRQGTRIYYVVDDAHVRRLVNDVVRHADHVSAHE
jgi:DNA-binding transcriptional ArsR family regulator